VPIRSKAQQKVDHPKDPSPPSKNAEVDNSPDPIFEEPWTTAVRLVREVITNISQDCIDASQLSMRKRQTGENPTTAGSE
jgi:hypothetical protein